MKAHRSVYQKFGAIFRYFDCLVVGLTATPREQVDRNHVSVVRPAAGRADGCVRAGDGGQGRVSRSAAAIQVNLKFPGRGIKYDDLSEAKRRNGNRPIGAMTRPRRRCPTAWTAGDQQLAVQRQHGRSGAAVHDGARAQGGRRRPAGKTIIFARNHEHALFIEQRFNHHYPQHAGSSRG
jgi:type I restriction enzyme R subunit